VDSPVWRLVQALNTLVSDGGNTPAIDGWFERVRALTARERALIAEARGRHDEGGVEARARRAALDRRPALAGGAGAPGPQPTVNIEGLVAGYTGPGGKTILPARGVAKLDLRLVPNMTVADSLPSSERISSGAASATSRSTCPAATIRPRRRRTAG
jgi:acetylornithine deacetylase/succinyl-diaminopimelate desuccinylase-like protein